MTLNALHRISLSMLLAVLLVGCIDAEEFDSTTDVAVTVDSSSADGDAGASDIVTPPDDAPEPDSVPDPDATGDEDAGPDVGANEDPAIDESNLEALEALEGEAFELQLTATDEEDDTLTWWLIDGPSEIEVNLQTGLLTWTPSYETVSGLEAFEDVEITVQVEEEQDDSRHDQAVFTVRVSSDFDEDGLADELDLCPELAQEPSSPEMDTDEDGEGDSCDEDLDGDGVDNDEDACPNVWDEEQEDPGEGPARRTGPHHQARPDSYREKIPEFHELR